jgi:hypothetical protein
VLLAEVKQARRIDTSKAITHKVKCGCAVQTVNVEKYNDVGGACTEVCGTVVLV